MKLRYRIINIALGKIKSDPECDPALPLVRKSALLFILTFLLTVILFITLYPFNFYPDNGIHWIQGGTGLYFDGQGMAYTDPVFSSKDFSDPKSISIELSLKNMREPNNWEVRDIFSFYDGSAKPSLLISVWGCNIFPSSRFEKSSNVYCLNKGRKNRPFSRGKLHFVTVTFSDIEKAVYIDGLLVEKKETVLGKNKFEGFLGRLLLGNSHNIERGWRGEIRGFALYDRVLDAEEVSRHYAVSRKEGIRALIDTPGLKLLYPFNESSGNIAHNIVDETLPVHIHGRRIAFKEAFYYLPTCWIGDFLLNIAFFIPLGSVLLLVFNHRGIINTTIGIVSVVFACGLLSLCIEISQLYIPGRAASIIDVVSNTTGAMLGSVSVCFFKRLRRMLLRNESLIKT
ncbi:MAG: hypothetical protein GY941_18040 [Planctomycetes bacterium]|nr:hypothetical protein [Planctomycetota bacterium]